MKNDLISIIVPIYNVEKYLDKCLASILNQTYSNLDIILVDDGSTDNSLNICNNYAKHDNRINVIHQKNAGVSSARNNGIKASKGKYISFIDADDWIDLAFIEKMYNAVLLNNSDICVCNYKIVTDEAEITNKNTLNNLSTSANVDLICDDTKYAGFSCNKLYKKQILSGIFFPENIKVLEDLIFNLDVWKKANKVIYIKEALYYYYTRTNSASHKKKLPNNFKAISIVYNELRGYKCKYENDYKLNYIWSYYVQKAFDKNFDKKEKRIKNEFEKIFSIKVFFKHGKLSIKIKILIIILFPKKYVHLKKDYYN